MSRPGTALTWITLGAVSVLCGCQSTSSRPSGGAPASASTTASPAVPSVTLVTSVPSVTPVAPVTPVTPVAPCAPFIVAPRPPDEWVDDAAALPVVDLGAWPSRPMAGPFTTRDLAMRGCTDVTRLAPAPPFDEIVACATGDARRMLGPDNIAVHVLLVRTARGFWAQEIVREHWPHSYERGGDPRYARVMQLAAGDHLGDSGAEITAIAEEGLAGGAKTHRLLVCGLGPSGVPACAAVPIRDDGHSKPGLRLYRLTLACDGSLSLAGWEGGGPNLVHSRWKLSFP